MVLRPSSQTDKFNRDSVSFLEEHAPGKMATNLRQQQQRSPASTSIISSNFQPSSTPFLPNKSTPMNGYGSAAAAVVSSSPASSPEQLELAARLLDVCQQSDFSPIAHDLKTRLGLNLQRLVDQPTFSGLNDSDYPNLEAIGLKEIREFATTSPTRIQPLPQDLLDQFARMQCSCSLGLFASIGRAWVTVDSDLFVWNYETNSDLAYFDGVPNTILSVGLVRPKANAFPPQSTPSYLLCVVTAVDVLLFAITFTDSENKPTATNFRTSEMHLMPEPLYRLSLDGAIVSDVASTKSGRIFLTARDCSLYEIDYQPQTKLFGKSCKKINYSKGYMSYLVPEFVTQSLGKSEPLSQVVIDDDRNILFTLSEHGSIQAYDLGSDGLQAPSKIGSLTSQEIQHAASNVAQTVEPSNFKAIAHITPITNSESSCINLVGVTQSGVRLFFTCYYVDPAISANMPSATPMGNQRPATLRLVHVRLPPGFSANTSVARPRMVHYGYHKRDLTAFVSAIDEDTDALWLFSNAQFGFIQGLAEVHAGLPIRGRTWALAENESIAAGGNLEFFESWRRKIGASSVLPPTIVTQHMELHRRVVALTVQGIHFFDRLRPVDLLRTLLSEFAPDSHQVRQFFELYHPNQACIMCITLACSTSHQNTVVADKAIRALYAFGGEPMIFNAGGRGRMDQSLASSYVVPNAYGQQQANFQQQRPFGPPSNPGDTNLNTLLLDTSPSAGYSTPYGGGGPPSIGGGFGGGADVKFSSRHNGLYGYFARIIGPLWSGRMVTDKVATSPSGKAVMQVDNSLTVMELDWILNQLNQFSDFLGKEVTSTKTVRGGGAAEIGYTPTSAFSSIASAEATSIQARQQGARRAQAEAIAAERQSLARLSELVQRCREVFGLWRILGDHQVHVVLSFLPNDLLETLKSVTVRQLVVSGKELCTDVITCIISTYVGDSAATDAISERLRYACPSIFTSDDATAAKATELLQYARNIDDAALKSRTISDALTMYKRVVGNIHLPTVCLQLEGAECFDGIVDLALCAAQKIDPQNAAVHYLKLRATAIAAGDDDPSELRQVFVGRMSCYKCVTDTLSHLLSAVSGRHPKLTPQAAQAWIDRILKLIFDNSDELFHYSAFEWMMENGLEDRLLQSPSAHLESYLHQCINIAPSRDAVQYLNLLWKFYEKDGRFTQAAKLLAKLAERHGTDLRLNERIAYLSRAVVCAKAAAGSSSQEAELMRELEDKLDVAKLQAQIVETLQQLRQPPAYVLEAIEKLNAELMDITRLYGEFAEEFNLAECKLAIIHCGGHYDPLLVETLWKEIVDKELALTTDESSAVRSKLLTKKLEVLATAYIRSPRYFPSDFLRKYLLTKSNDIGLDTEYLRKFILNYLR